VLRAGMATDVFRGSAPKDARPFNSFLADDFDRWVAARHASTGSVLQLTENAVEIRESLPEQVRPFFRELSLHGNWVQSEQFGYVWLPQVPDPGWRPYRLGHWGYGRRGYFWISHEPWGWAPYHYGRWIWLGDLRWGWVPGSVFSGAWVTWSWGTSHVGWCALDFWNRPARRSPNGGGPIDPLSWTVVAYEHVGRIDAADLSVDPDRAGELEPVRLAARPPRVPPSELAEPEGRQRAMAALERSGSLSPAEVEAEGKSRLRSFRDLERSGLPAVVPCEAPSADPASSSSRARVVQTEFRPSSTARLGPRGLEEPTTEGLRAQPASTQPTVHFERGSDVGTTELWKRIYRTMAQPRPTEPRTKTELELRADDELSPLQENPGDPQAATPRPTRLLFEKKRGERDDRKRRDPSGESGPSLRER
jgi:hypothetical protein